ncbi:hypothetical protein, partial [Enterobacter kobei]|uniref:hypothetical protein n=1 Tax=Enterobacter kobei TaxID=208224 RepID=UPI0013D0C597
MEEDDFRRDQIAPYRDLVDRAGPIRARRIREVGIEGEIPTLLTQSWRGMEPGVGVSVSPRGEKQ